MDELNTAQAVAVRTSVSLADADAAVIAVGFTDVLLMTPPTWWADSLSRVITQVQQDTGSLCESVPAGCRRAETWATYVYPGDRNGR